MNNQGVNPQKRKVTKSFIRKEIGIGLLFSAMATATGFFAYVEFLSEFDFRQTLEKIQEGDLLSSVLALSALPNLFVFFIFIKKKQDYRARGVLMATILTALITFALKLV